MENLETLYFFNLITYQEAIDQKFRDLANGTYFKTLVEKGYVNESGEITLPKTKEAKEEFVNIISNTPFEDIKGFTKEEMQAFFIDKPLSELINKEK